MPNQRERRFVAISVLVVTLAGAGTRAGASSSSSGPAVERPNVLLIVIDTLRADHVGAYGAPVPTPTLDALASNGVLFEHAVSHVPTTLPAHASMFTSRYPVDHGVRVNGFHRLRESETTIAESFDDAGYDTGAFVGAFVLDARFGLAQGFDHYDDRLEARETSIHDLVASERSAEAVLSRAADWIEGRENEWFVFVHLFDPHAPYSPPSSYRERFPRDPYTGEIAYVDAALGGFFARLRRSEMFDDAVIVVTSDHGEGLGEHGEATHGLFAYESTLRVPLIINAPGRIPSGRVISTRARHVDIAPTLASLAGVPWPGVRRGASLMALVFGDTNDRDSYFESLSYHIKRGQAPLYGLYRGKFKYIDLPIEELYDIFADVGERRNLYMDHSADVTRLARALDDIRAGTVDADVVAVDAGTRRRLESLGYVAHGAADDGNASRPFTANDDPKRLIDLNSRFDAGLSAYQQGRLSAALRLLRAVLDERPTYGSAYQYLASAHHARGELDESVRVLNRAVEHGVASISVRAQLGAYLLEGGHLSAARTALASVLEMNPAHVDALESMAILLDMSGERAAAIEMLENAVRVSPSAAGAWANLGTMQLGAEDIASAENALLQAVDIDPRLASAWNALGALYHSGGRDDDAVQCWKRAAERDNAPLEALYNLGFVLAQRDRLDEARRYLERFAREASPERHASELEDVRWLLDRLLRSRAVDDPLEDSG